MDYKKKNASTSAENAADASTIQPLPPATTVNPAIEPEIKKPGDLTTQSGGRKLTRHTGKKPARRKNRRLWVWALILVVLVGAGVGAYFVWFNPSQTNTRFVGQTTTVNTTTVVGLTVAATGQVQAKADLPLTFGSAGTVTEVLAKQGDIVKKGQVIAKIDDSDLQSVVKTAQASLTSAKSNLDTTKAGATDTDIQKAEEQLKQARLNVEKTTNGTGLPSDIQSARSQLAAARAKLAQDQQGGTDSDKASAQASINSAQANLSSAQSKLDQLLAGPDAATISSAQVRVDQAQINLDKTKSNLNTAVINAQTSKDQALTALNRAQDAYSSVYNNNHNADGSLKSGLKDTDIANETAARRDLQDAQGNYNKADVALNDAKVNYDTGIRNAQASLDDAKVQLAAVKAGPTQADITAARATVDQAKASLDTANANLAKLTPTDATIAADQAAVDSAQANLIKLTTGGTPTDIEIAQSNVVIQEATLQSLKDGPTPSTIAIAQAQVDTAQANYDKAVAQLDNAVVKAPFDGQLASVGVIPGQLVTASTAVAQIVDTSELHVDVSVGESDISKVKMGMGVTLNFDAITGRSFTGKISFISPKATVTSNVVSYLVTVTLDSAGKNSLQDYFPAEYQKYIDVIRAASPQLRPASTTTAGATTAAGATTTTANTTTQPVAQIAALRSELGFCGYVGGFGGGQGAAGGQRTGGGQRGGAAGAATTTTPDAASGTPAAEETAQAQTRNQNVTLTEPKIGMTSSVSICENVKAGVLSVPTRAIKTNTTTRQKYVEVLDASGNQVIKNITTGLAGDTNTEITGGDLKAGDQVILSTTPTNRSTGNNGFGGGGGNPLRIGG